MSIETTAPPAERLLETARKLFTAHGIRAVGIDQILAEAKVAKASLYQAYGSKESLVVAYLERQDALDRTAYRAATTGVEDPRQHVLKSFELAATKAESRGFRGCAFLNAATEFPISGHPIAEAVEVHREWVRSRWLLALTVADVPDAELKVSQLQVLYDGAVAGSKAARSVAPIHLARAMATATINSTVLDPTAISASK